MLQCYISAILYPPKQTWVTQPDYLEGSLVCRERWCNAVLALPSLTHLLLLCFKRATLGSCEAAATAAPAHTPVHFMDITRDSAPLFELGLVTGKNKTVPLSASDSGLALQGGGELSYVTLQRLDKSLHFSRQTNEKGVEVWLWYAWQVNINRSVVYALTSNNDFFPPKKIQNCIKEPQIRHFFPKGSVLLCSEIAKMLQTPPPPPPPIPLPGIKARRTLFEIHWKH